MPLGTLTPYYHGRAKKRVEGVYTDTEGRFVVSVQRNRKRKRRICKDLAEARYWSENLNLLFADKDEQSFELLSDLIKRYQPEYDLHHSCPKTVATQGENLIRLLGNLSLEQIGPHLAPSFLSQRLAEKVGPKAANDDLRRLHALLNLATRDKLLSKNPFSGWGSLKEPPARTRWLTYDEEDAILAECDEEFGRLVQIAALSGMRQAEQLTSEVSQVLWKTSSLYLPLTKNGDARHVPMGDDLIELIRAQVALGSKWLCPNRSRSNRWLRDNLTRYFDKAVARAGVEDFTWHDLRHTYCSRLAMSGVQLRTIQILAGHKSIKTTERYAHLSAAHLAEAVKKLDRGVTRDDTEPE